MQAVGPRHLAVDARAPVLLPRRRTSAIVRPAVLEALSLLGVAALTVGTRLLTHGRYLFNWDAIQFALGVQRFDLVAHRPHPPGYLGYIALGRIFTAASGGDPQVGLVLLSAVAEGAGVLLAYCAARALWGRFAGWAAALLLASSPLFWIYGGAALTYALEPTLAIAVTWLAYRACQGDRRSLVAGAVVAALAGAIRPTDEVFLAVPLAWAGWRGLRRGDRAVLAAALGAGVAATLAWLMPLLVASGGIFRYVVASRELSARASATSAVWKLGAEGLRINGSAVVFALVLALGSFLPLLLTYLLSRRAARVTLPGPPLGRDFLVLAAALLLPALAVYDLVHIGQMGYVLLLLPALVLPAGVVLDSLARAIAGNQRAPIVRGVALAACVVANVAIFALPTGGMRDQVVQHDTYTTAVLATVQRFDPNSTVLLTDADAEGSYRMAQYYLPAYPVVAVGRDRREHAGEMFSTRGPAPEYDLARFDRTGPISFPAGTRTVLVLDRAALDVTGDRSGLGAVPFGAGWKIWVLHDDLQPVAFGSRIYLRAQDCPCRGASGAKPIPIPSRPL
jgi:hypothetical protein